jgi:K+-transporting ATPase ATPase A chain
MQRPSTAAAASLLLGIERARNIEQSNHGQDNRMSHAALYLAVLAALAAPLGWYIHRVMEATPERMGRCRRFMEKALFRCCGVDAGVEMDWRAYARALVVFNAIGALVLYGLQRVQGWLPLNPEHLAGVSPDSAFNTAVSFASNTSWQSYTPESTMGYLVQMLGITVQSFLSAATGIAVVMVLMRGFTRVHAKTIGNAWIDLTRAGLGVFLPLSIIFAILLVGQGAIQNFSPYQHATTLDRTTYQAPVTGADGAPLRDAAGNPVTAAAVTQAQVLPMGPAASQTSIALLSGDGGGFFNANSAHPFANPTSLSNFLEIIAILIVPAALCITLGIAVRDRRQGWAIFTAMAIAFLGMAYVAIQAEHGGNAQFAALRIDQAGGPLQAGGNMEGKETRFGVDDSALFATVTTSGGDGAVNSAHESYTPIGGMVPLALMQLGEVVFGGPGSGLYGMLVYAVMAIFIASLMIGRAPEYLGKPIETFEMKMASIVVLTPPMIILIGTATAVMLAPGRAGIGNPGAHGFTEVLYALSSTANNNGSAFAGLSANTPFYNVLTALAMWLGRFVPLLAVLAMAGSLATKKRRAPGLGTLPTHGPMFVGLLLATVFAIGALTFVPALALGPIVEHLQSAVSGVAPRLAGPSSP